MSVASFRYISSKLYAYIKAQYHIVVALGIFTTVNCVLREKAHFQTVFTFGKVILDIPVSLKKAKSHIVSMFGPYTLCIPV
jgi:hypothetical protein